MKKLLFVILISCFMVPAEAQLLKKIIDKTKQKTEDKVAEKISEKASDAATKPIDDAGSGKKKDGSKDTAKNINGNNSSSGTNGSTDNSNVNGKGAAAVTASLATYSKYDFVPGEKVLVVEDFAQDAVGDFPARWNTNGSGEVVTVSGQTGRWLMISKKGRFIPEFITALPDNFTFQYDVICNEKFS
jgi:OmpA-OmpF porin, OOP family